MIFKIDSFKNANIFKNVFPKDNNGRIINIYNINNCLVSGINLYYPNVLLYTENENKVFLPLLEKTMSLKTSTIYEKYNMEYDYTKKQIDNTCDFPVFFFVYNTDNYFHFLYDTLPYLISFLELKKIIPNLKLLMQYPNEQKNVFYPFIIEFLELLDIYSNDIIIINENTVYSNIYISTSYTHDIDSNLPPKKEIYHFYQNIVNIVKQKINNHSITPKKIYVSRRTWLHNDFSNIGTNYTTRRKFVNEDDLVERLSQEGYEEVFTEKLSTIEKIVYFANATHVVGAIGGGISNVLFSPPTTHLEAIVSPTFLDINLRFKYSLDCVNVYYNYNTIHEESSEFKKFMRVKSKNNTIIGEIEQIYDNKLLISYNDGSNNGWNSLNHFNQIELDIQEIEKLDNGLNSSWILL
jgi:capsular polysaccharide biosynthesis protein